MTPAWKSFFKEVYACTACDGAGFTALKSGAPFFKFPPVIGKMSAPVPLLFVGINPRLSRSNRQLHHELMASKAAYAALAGNRAFGKSYIARNGSEKHYTFHLSVVEALFGKVEFETVAAVTELFYCATPDAKALPLKENPCASRFFRRTVSLLEPKVIVAVGSTVYRSVITQFGQGNEVVTGEKRRPLILMPHPAARITIAEKEKLLREAIAEIKSHLQPHRA